MDCSQSRRSPCRKDSRSLASGASVRASGLAPCRRAERRAHRSGSERGHPERAPGSTRDEIHSRKMSHKKSPAARMQDLRVRRDALFRLAQSASRSVTRERDVARKTKNLFPRSLLLPNFGEERAVDAARARVRGGSFVDHDGMVRDRRTSRARPRQPTRSTMLAPRVRNHCRPSSLHPRLRRSR